MEFDEAMDGATPWETAHEATCRKFADAGLGATLPLIVYWNLRSSRSIPVTASKRGTILLSGFSVGVMESLLGLSDGDITPRGQMVALLSKECYERLVLRQQQ
jgi:hypothetical protein